MIINKVRLSEQVYREIKRMIVEEGFVPGDKFYSENQLTEKLQVSRSSIREAIRLLEVGGFVTVLHGKGIFIADPDQNSTQAFESWLRDNEQSLNDHFEIRLIIDPKAAAAAARRATKEDRQKLMAICETFKLKASSGSTADLIAIDEKFHLQLAKATKNRTLYMMMKTMTQSLPEGWITSLHVPGRIKKTIDEHYEIARAIEEGNSDKAEKSMLTHLTNALNEIRSTLKEKKEAPDDSRNHSH